MSRKYKKLKDGEGIEVSFVGGKSGIVKLGCCDCGLIHRMAFAIEPNGNLGIAMARDKRATAAARRHIKGLWLPKGGAF